MYKVVNLTDNLSVLSEYKLCYIDSINRTYTDYTPEAKSYQETDEYKNYYKIFEEYCNKKFKEQGYYSTSDPEYRSIWNNDIIRRGTERKDYPNPDYIPGEQIYYAYFTPIELSEQNGDDWNDTPYEYNAGEPYDVDYDKDNHANNYTIIKIPFCPKSYNVMFPRDWGHYENSPFCINDINSGAVAWIYDYNYNMKKSVVIHAGVSPEKFRDSLKEIEMNNPGWTYYSNDDEDD